MIRLWDLPVPSTALLGGGVVFEKRLRREVALCMRYEDEGSDRDVALDLVFEGVEAVKVTYGRARSRGMVEAYDHLVDVGGSDWLMGVVDNLKHNGGEFAGLKHLMIDFDDGPSYEFICRAHRLETAFVG